MKCHDNEIIGIIPAGGFGKRMMPFRIWKELIHVGYRTIEKEDGLTHIPKVVSEYTLENMIEAGASKIVIVINEQKSDVFRFFANGENYNVNILYACQDWGSKFSGMPIAIDTPYPWTKNHTILMGMPDTIVEPFDSFKQLIKYHDEKKSDLTIGVFPTHCPERLAPVVIDKKTGRVKKIYDKPKNTSIYNTWSIVAWSNVFTEFLHNYVNDVLEGKRESGKEILLSDIFTAAVEEGLEVYGLFYPNGVYHDLGDINEFIISRHKIENSILSDVNISY